MGLRLWTPPPRAGSLLFVAALIFGCSGDRPARASPPPKSPAKPATPSNHEKRPGPEPHLGVADRGIFSDLDKKVQIALPTDLTPARARAVVDRKRRILVLYDRDWPVKAYPLAGEASLRAGEVELSLRPGDRAELEPLLGASDVRELGPSEAPPPGDADGDGLPDPLDLLVGARKTVANGASYGAGYIRLEYPGGDVPRGVGVCTDVVVRAVRNLGLDIQRALQEDIRRAPRAYPMVERKNPNIDHRRVRTLLPYFRRRWEAHSAEVDDESDPLRPGDILFMDTLSRRGPDHIGIVSERTGDSGLPLVINNWTDGTKTAEMDLLGWVPVTHRFRIPGG